ncbi:Ribonucleoprotein LSM domain eukaryotic/archaea-type [Penicillium manginii]|uniref:Ribonucleoprotein LSM domain eukaryotic/archaea-type n=1 Tax=Penicillium manginii TaxID=203109 RepID=UPI002547834D|nr:Ribonucleoprotein LSM domain eukaryotic/archaea-type [Penicillium manginii]KAJ5750444.1 Ribonucleoprotein LSM domain eukaryotic/archaea-type [Penicillium manginii]
MSLKRKASFSAMPSSPFVPASSDWEMTDSSKHLHSRTRKRFRDGRPNEEAVYAKTLRWIFSAQKQQNEPSMDTCDEVMDSEPTETIDPRQQSLLRFFQPRTQSGPSFKPSREALAPRANETAVGNDDALRREAFERINSVDSACGSETTSPGFNQMDVDMDMDTDESCESSTPGVNIGVTSWM